jgi:hypothetical protein
MLRGQHLGVSSLMPFDTARYPNAVTVGWLIAERMGMGVHFHPCGSHVVLNRRPSRLRPSWNGAARARAADHDR